MSLPQTEGARGSPSSTRWRTGVSVAVTAFVITHVLLLRSPVYPAGDETVMAALTRSVMLTGRLRFDPAPQWVDAAVLAYGPVYFAITAPIMRWLGIGVVQYRLVSLAAGFGLVAALVAILKARQVAWPGAAIVTAAFALDPILTQSMHYGRMDTLATALVFGALLILIEPPGPASDRRIPPWRLLVAGTLIGVAILTTPRVALTAAPLAIVVPKWQRRRVTEWALDVALLGLPIAALYSVWMVEVFGGPRELVRYYSRLSGFATPHLVVARVQLPLLVVAAAAILWAASRRMHAFIGPLTLASLAGVILFYLIVREISGLYLIYVLPFCYILIAEALGRERRWLRLLPIALLTFANAVVAVHYASTFVANDRAGGTKPLERFIADVIPLGSRVIGDDIFYFAAIRTGNQYLYMNLYGTEDERERYQRDAYDYQYLLWSDRLEQEQPGLLQLYQRRASLEAVARYPDAFVMKSFWRAVGVPPFRSLGMTVYRRRESALR